MMTAMVIAMLTAITVWWLLIQRLKDKPWTKQGVVPTSQEGITSSAPKVGLWVFLVVVASLFGIFASAYTMRMQGHGGLTAWQPLDEPSVLWLNTLVLVFASGAMQIARNRIDKDDIAGGRGYFFGAGLLTVAFLAGQILAWQQASQRRLGSEQPGVRLLRATDRRARLAHARRSLGARPHDGAAVARHGIDQRRNPQPTAFERATLHDLLALVTARLARPVRFVVVDLRGTLRLWRKTQLLRRTPRTRRAGTPSSPTGPRTNKRSACRGARR
jgi:hypothetical protein